jgi:3-hydroxyacyl-CoA dehydrogenase/enoyl-CoA hydratase/3-hydroxybutyryl-CoA epimerase
MNGSGTSDLNHWRQEKDSDGIVWWCIDKADASANVLSEQVLRELVGMLEPMEQDPPRGIVLYSGKRNGFVMGADINEFTSIESAEQAYELIRLGQQIFDRLEALRCPTVAVINGFALGGGLELALACDYRLALHNKKPIIGLPEVQLGLHPGFGGTVRAVRVAGVRAAMQLMLTGKPITVEKALRQGFVDRVAAPDNWKQAAREIIVARNPKATAALTERCLNLFFLRPLIVRILRKQVAARARKEHYPAPYAIIDLWAQHGASSRTGFDAEARSFAELMVTSTSRNLVRVFFLQNRLKSQGGRPDQKISRVHIVGAGVMGGDIAAWCALRGLDVTLQDRGQEYIDPALKRAAKLFSKKLKHANDRAAASDRLRTDIEGDGIADADLIIEAIFEDLDAKQSLYEKIQSSMKPGAILATNTSSIRLEDLRTVLNEPERFIGLHFFNPVAVLPLVEVIRCDDTEQAALDAGFAFVKDIGKVPLECASSPGFVVNRLLAPYMAEAMHLAESGVPLAAIDKAAVDFGMPMGPVELLDSIGIDVALHVSRVLGTAFKREVPDVLAEMVDNGHLGRKSGRGFYEWRDGKAVKPPLDESDVPVDLGDRLILPIVNEAVACLHEGVVSDADLLDAGVIFGTGFAPFRGGPLHYARSRGVQEILRTMERLEARHGDRFRPHHGWANIEGNVD